MSKLIQKKGKIIKGIAGFYYVRCEANSDLIECKAKGILRKNASRPLVGDDVIITILDEEKHLGNLIEILKRKNELVRPAVANIDQVLIFFASVMPDPNFVLLDRMLAKLNKLQVECFICFNKEDLCSNREAEEAVRIYSECGYRVFSASVIKQAGVTKLRTMLLGKTTVLAGPSGVGKSSFINLIYPLADMETGEISKKTDRGRHTTRHTQLFCVEEDTYLMDTPGFTALENDELSPEEIRESYKEFLQYEPSCRFQGCSHITEPDCVVKEALVEGKINHTRYENYCVLYKEATERMKYGKNYRKGLNS